MNPVTHAAFRSPRGRAVILAYREGTNDANVLRSCLDEDEYRLADLHLSGTALDVGAHIGGATLALALDNPDLRVVAIEPIPENVQLLRENVERAGVAGQVEVIEGAAGPDPVTIRYNFIGDESAIVHRYIGNQHMPAGTPYVEIDVPGHTLSDLVEQYGPFAFLKTDCEGCETTFLDDPAIAKVARIHGEWHDGGRTELRFS